MEFDPPPTQAMIAFGQLAFGFENLGPGFAAYDAMKVAHHRWIRMRT